MKQLQTISYLALMFIAMTSFSQCSSTQNSEDKAPLKIGEVYCQKWIAGVQGGGSGINLFIPTEQSSIKLDSVYFRNRVVKLELNPKDGILYIGRFKSEFNQKKDIIMSNEPNAEYGNPMLEIKKKTPFELKDNECIISYNHSGKTKYFKIENIAERVMIPYPSAPPNKQ